MELIEKQRSGGRMYAHEFLEEAGSMSTKENTHIRTDEHNKEGKSGRWTAGNSSSGNIVIRTNVPEVLAEIQRKGSITKSRFLIVLPFLAACCYGVVKCADFCAMAAPLSSVFEGGSTAGFDPERFMLGCDALATATSRYIWRQLIAPQALSSLIVIVWIRKLWKSKLRHAKSQRSFTSMYANSAGTILSTLFISIAMSCILPLICYDNSRDSENGA